MNSRTKGKRGELEFANALKRAGLASRRTQQYCGSTGNASDVVIEGEDLHVEVKRCERPRLIAWLKQVHNDANGRDWILAWRAARQEWMVTLPLAKWVELRHAARTEPVPEDLPDGTHREIQARAAIQRGIATATSDAHARSIERSEAERPPVDSPA